MFWDRVEVTGFCWEWTGSRDSQGYGKLRTDGVTWRAHRLSWVLLMGPIEMGLELDHLCRNTSCVNPDHLEPVTREENQRRKFEARVTCPKGHLYAGFKVSHGKSIRKCLECDRQYSARRRARLREELLA